MYIVDCQMEAVETTVTFLTVLAVMQVVYFPNYAATKIKQNTELFSFADDNVGGHNDP